MMASSRARSTTPDTAAHARRHNPTRPTARRSFSESRSQSGTIDTTHSSDSSRSPRNGHQRALSASSLAAPDSAAWTAKRSARLASVLRTGLRKSPGAEPRPPMRARAATDISADYVAVAVGTADMPAISSGSSRPASREADDSTFRPRKRSLSVGGESRCNDFYARQIEQYGLEPLLGSPVATCYFLASLIASFAPESLLFYLEAEHFRTAAFADNALRTRYAKGLYKAFISQRAPMEINISHNMRLRVSNVFRNAEPVTPMIFQETQSHVRALLEQEFSQFRQRALFARMLAELTTGRKDGHAQHVRAVGAVYDALSATYSIRSLSANKARLVQAEAPSFTKFADMELTSSELRVALPAWLCRTTIRLLDTPLPSLHESMHPPASAPPTDLPPSTSLPHPRGNPHAVVLATASAKKPTKQKSMQRLRFRFQLDSNSSHSPGGPSSAPATVKSRWESLWSSRRRKA